jgi:hypothetical protein
LVIGPEPPRINPFAKLWGIAEMDDETYPWNPLEIIADDELPRFHVDDVSIFQRLCWADCHDSSCHHSRYCHCILRLPADRSFSDAAARFANYPSLVTWSCAVSRNDTLIGISLKIAAMVLQQSCEALCADVQRGWDASYALLWLIAPSSATGDQMKPTRCSIGVRRRGLCRVTVDGQLKRSIGGDDRARAETAKSPIQSGADDIRSKGFGLRRTKAYLRPAYAAELHKEIFGFQRDIVRHRIFG